MYPMLFLLHEHAVQSQLDDIRCVYGFVFSISIIVENIAQALSPRHLLQEMEYIHLIDQQFALDLSMEKNGSL